MPCRRAAAVGEHGWWGAPGNRPPTRGLRVYEFPVLVVRAAEPVGPARAPPRAFPVFSAKASLQNAKGRLRLPAPPAPLGSRAPAAAALGCALTLYSLFSSLRFIALLVIWYARPNQYCLFRPAPGSQGAGEASPSSAVSRFGPIIESDAESSQSLLEVVKCIFRQGNYWGAPSTAVFCRRPHPRHAKGA